VDIELGRFHLKMDTETASETFLALNKSRTMNNVQKHGVFTIGPLSRPFRPYLSPPTLEGTKLWALNCIVLSSEVYREE
jgi:hypothetical protein